MRLGVGIMREQGYNKKMTYTRMYATFNIFLTNNGRLWIIDCPLRIYQDHIF